jgi:hypothetical protein
MQAMGCLNFAAKVRRVIMAKKSLMLLVFTAIVAEWVFAQPESKEIRIKNPDKGFFVFSGLLYGYEKITPDPVIETNGLNLQVGFGYDIGRINFNLLVEYTLIGLVEAEYITYLGYTNELKPLINLSAGFNMGIKILDGNMFDIAVPIGVLFHITTLKINEYYSNEYSPDIIREFGYYYLNVESGVILSLRLSNMYSIFLPFYIGYPVYKTMAAVNYSAAEDYKVLNFSAGLCFKLTF